MKIHTKFNKKKRKKWVSVSMNYMIYITIYSLEDAIIPDPPILCLENGCHEIEL